jgi:purine-nucleoside phosphorylase
LKKFEVDNNLKLAVILGSGLDIVADYFPEKKIISEDLKGVHKKKIVIVNDGKNSCLLFCGRKHYYEGYSSEEIISNITFAAEMGIENIFITNAAGGLNENFDISDLMLIRSHINFIRNFKFFGSGVFYYNKNFSSLILKICKELKIKIYEGIYCYSHGPAYETNSEIKMMKKFNVDAVGMSTIPEIIYSYSKRINVAGISIITNILKENISTNPNHNEILKSSSRASGNIYKIIRNLLLLEHW